MERERENTVSYVSQESIDPLALKSIKWAARLVDRSPQTVRRWFADPNIDTPEPVVFIETGEVYVRGRMAGLGAAKDGVGK